MQYRLDTISLSEYSRVAADIDAICVDERRLRASGAVEAPDTRMIWCNVLGLACGNRRVCEQPDADTAAL